MLLWDVVLLTYRNFYCFLMYMCVRACVCACVRVCAYVSAVCGCVYLKIFVCVCPRPVCLSCLCIC